MKKIKIILIVFLLSCVTAAALRGQSDRVKYVPKYKDPLLEQMEAIRDSLKSVRDSTTDAIIELQDQQKKEKEDREKKLRFDFTSISKPSSPEVFTTAFHFPPVPQYYTGTCWAFAGTSFLESEVARQTGRKIKLSEMHTVYYEYIEKCRNFIRRRGDFHVSQGSEANAVLRITNLYGIVPRDIYPGYIGDEKYDHTLLTKEIKAYLNLAKENALWDEEFIISGVRLILNKYMGEPPNSFDFEGRTLTPLTFAWEILRVNAGDYVGVISTLSIPYYQQGELEAWDNWWHDSTYYNLPLEEWYRIMKETVVAGYTVTIGGDVSEPGYNGFEDAAVVPDFDIPQAYINQDAREFRLNNRTTGDEHGIHVVGYKAIDDRDWFLIKDSSRSGRWGNFEGYFFYRDDYIRLKMMSFLVHKDALKSVIKKFDRADLN
ncbi:MAG: peptidase C1 [candidate division Zixibacteria bacterium]|nr:peptidase C1 [candidate division Zixibacteria bacterium]